MINWKLFFKQKSEDRFYLKEVKVSMNLTDGSGKHSTGLGERSVGFMEGVEILANGKIMSYEIEDVI